MNGDGMESEEDDDVSKASMSESAEDCREKDVGRVVEEKADGGTEGGERRDEPLVSDWVACQEDEEDEEKMSDERVSNGSGFHCACLWIPFSPFTWAAGVSDLAASGGRACEERDRGGGLGEARPC